MNWKHLFWIIPAALILGFLFGFVCAQESLMKYLATDAGVQTLCKYIGGIS